MARRTLIPAVVYQAQSRLEGLYGSRLREVVLFGSLARNEAQEGSDIDLLVVLDAVDDVEVELERVDPIASQLSLEHDVVLSILVMGAQEYFERRSPLLLNIRRGGVAL